MSCETFDFLVENELYWFDAAAVERVKLFIETFCKLSAPLGAPFILLPWQRQIVHDVFGWKRRDNDERRFNEVYIEVPRKNGKSYFVSALALYLLIADGQDSPEVYVAASNREQSGIVYKDVVSMIRQSKWLGERTTIVQYKSLITAPKRNGILRALSREGKGSHGTYPSAVIRDELHEWTGSKAESLAEALTSGWGGRNSPLLIDITTAGFGSQPTMAKQQHEKALRFAAGKCEQPNFYGVVYGADLDDDWTSESTWQKANPSYNLVKKNLANEIAKAKASLSAENSFKRLYLDVWTQQQTRWLSMERWDECTDATLTLESLKGRDVVIGMDLGSTYDLTALSLLFRLDNGSWAVFCRCFMPSKSVERYTTQDAIPYSEWAKSTPEGAITPYLTATNGVSKGVTVDFGTVIAAVLQIKADFNLLHIGFDPAGAAQVVPPLENDHGIPCTPIYQNLKDMTAGAKELERRLVSGELPLERNPCFRWQAGNVEVKEKDGMIKPVKPHSEGAYGGTAKYKVDGITATVIAAQTALLLFGMPKAEETKAKPQVFFVKR